MTGRPTLPLLRSLPASGYLFHFGEVELHLCFAAEHLDHHGNCPLLLIDRNDLSDSILPRTADHTDRIALGEIDQDLLLPGLCLFLFTEAELRHLPGRKRDHVSSFMIMRIRT